MTNSKCINCGKEFEARRATAKFCCSDCRVRSFRKERATAHAGLTITCANTDEFELLTRTLAACRAKREAGARAEAKADRQTKSPLEQQYDECTDIRMISQHVPGQRRQEVEFRILMRAPKTITGLIRDARTGLLRRVTAKAECVGGLWHMARDLFWYGEDDVDEIETAAAVDEQSRYEQTVLKFGKEEADRKRAWVHEELRGAREWINGLPKASHNPMAGKTVAELRKIRSQNHPDKGHPDADPVLYQQAVEAIDALRGGVTLNRKAASS
jgi:DNA-directed RNA polymerase subunit RPC12/RpoP